MGPQKRTSRSVTWLRKLQKSGLRPWRNWRHQTIWRSNWRWNNLRLRKTLHRGRRTPSGSRTSKKSAISEFHFASLLICLFVFKDFSQALIGALRVMHDQLWGFLRKSCCWRAVYARTAAVRSPAEVFEKDGAPLYQTFRQSSPLGRCKCSNQTRFWKVLARLNANWGFASRLIFRFIIVLGFQVGQFPISKIDLFNINAVVPWVFCFSNQLQFVVYRARV